MLRFKRNIIIFFHICFINILTCKDEYTMILNHQKELDPVLYDSSGLKIHHFNNWGSNILLSNMHWHERMELILVVSGSLHFRLSNHESILTENQLAIISPKLLHYVMTGENGCTCKTVMFDIDAFYNQLSTTERLLKPVLDQTISFLPWTDHPKVISVMKSIVEEPTTKDAFSPLSKMGKIYEMIALLYRYCLVEKESEVISPSQFQDVLDYINTSFDKDISSSDLCQRFGYSEGYFCRQFRTVTGFSPMIYIRILRLEKAREMLHKEQIPIGKIATRCGFSNANYFTRCFKSHFNMTPSEYMQKQKIPQKNGLVVH